MRGPLRRVGTSGTWPGLRGRVRRRRVRTEPKNARSDADVLANLRRIGYLPQVWLAPEEIRELRGLVRFRTQKVEQRTQVKLRIRAPSREHRFKAPEGRAAWTRRWVRWLRPLELDPISAFLRKEHLAVKRRWQPWC